MHGNAILGEWRRRCGGVKRGVVGADIKGEKQAARIGRAMGAMSGADY